jgi:hypothetical protein
MWWFHSKSPRARAATSKVCKNKPASPKWQLQNSYSGRKDLQSILEKRPGISLVVEESISFIPLINIDWGTISNCNPSCFVILGVSYYYLPEH